MKTELLSTSFSIESKWKSEGDDRWGKWTDAVECITDGFAEVEACRSFRPHLDFRLVRLTKEAITP